MQESVEDLEIQYCDNTRALDRKERGREVKKRKGVKIRDMKGMFRLNLNS